MSAGAPRDPAQRLIDQLASDLEPVQPIAPIPRGLAAVAAVTLAVALVAFGVYGLRANLWGDFVGDVTWAGVLVGLALAVIGACTATLASVVPGRERLLGAGAAAAGVGIALAVAVAAAATPWGSPRFDAPLSQLACVVRGSAFAGLPALVVLGLAARGWAARPGWTAALGMLGAGAVGALLVHLTCPAVAPLHLLCTHASTPLLLATGLGLALAPLMRRLAR